MRLADVRKRFERPTSIWFSSNVASMDYDPDEEIMSVTFHNGGTYYYYDVPEEVFDAVRTGAIDNSVGRTLHREVKLPGYDYERQ